MSSKGKLITPVPGFCLKTKNEDGKKVFLNFCSSSEMRDPPALADEEIALAIASPDPPSFRLPLSLGPPHEELDHNSQSSVAFDVAISTKFVDSALSRPLVLQLLVAAALEGIEAKYDLSLSRDWNLLKNKKVMGTIQPQCIRTAEQQPLISELSPQMPNSNKVERVSLPSDSFILREPPTGPLERLLVVLRFSQLMSSRLLQVSTSPNRLVVSYLSHSNGANCESTLADIELPCTVVTETANAHFVPLSRLLVVSLLPLA